MSRIVLNGLEITQEAAKERLDGKDPIAGLLYNSRPVDTVQTLLLEDNAKLETNSALIIVFDKANLSLIQKITLKLTQTILNISASKNKQ